MSTVRKQCPGCGEEHAVNKDGRLRQHAGPDCAVCPQEPSQPGPHAHSYADAADAEPDRHAHQDSKGPWFGAMYDGRCSVSECQIYEGDRIRADGQGGYECEDCGDFDDTMDRHVRVSLGIEPADDDPGPVIVVDSARVVTNWQEQASAAAKRHLEFLKDVPETHEEVGALVDRAPVVELRVPADPGPMPTPEEFLDPFDLPAKAQDAPRKINVSGQPEPRRDWQGRYIVKDPALGDFRWQKNGKPKGIMRVTTFVKRASDNKAINDWQKRNVLMGAVLRPDVVRRAHGLTHETGKDELNRIVGELDTAAGGKVSADEGTYLHEETEFIDAGLKTWRDSPPAYQQDLKRYVEALARYGLEPVPGLIERTVMISEFGGVVGTFDRVFYHRPSGSYVIGDLKTGKTLKYGMDEIQAQIWCYAHGVNQNGVYDWNTDAWGFAQDKDRYDQAEWGHAQLQVREDVGAIIHMPVQGPGAGAVYVRKANLVKGKAYAELCADVRAWPKSKVEDWEGLASPSWEERFRTVGGKQDATDLWLAAKAEGLAGMELDRLVKMAQHRLRELGF